MVERIWDPYLSERDRARAAASVQPRVGFGNKPGLLLIDMYRWVFGDEPEPLLDAVKRWPGSCGLAGWESLPYVQELLEAAREAAIPVAYVTGLPEKVSGMKDWRYANRGGQPPPPLAGPDYEDRVRRQFDIVDEVAPAAGEVVLQKTAPSAFFGTPLVNHFIKEGVDTIIVAGETTSGCVRASVVDGCSHRFRMIVVEECVFDRDEAPHAINLFDMHEKYADVVPLTEARAALSDYAARTGTGAVVAASG